MKYLVWSERVEIASGSWNRGEFYWQLMRVDGRVMFFFPGGWMNFDSVQFGLGSDKLFKIGLFWFHWFGLEITVVTSPCAFWLHSIIWLGRTFRYFWFGFGCHSSSIYLDLIRYWKIFGLSLIKFFQIQIDSDLN